MSRGIGTATGIVTIVGDMPENRPVDEKPQRVVKEKPPRVKKESNGEVARFIRAYWPIGLALILLAVVSFADWYWRDSYVVLVVAVVLLVAASLPYKHTRTRPVPQCGWQGYLYKLLSALHISYIPKRGISEELAIEGDDHASLADEMPGDRGVIFVVIGIATGSGKGTFVSNAGALSAMYTRMWTLLLDIRPKLGNIALRFGLRRRSNESDPNVLVKGATGTTRQAMKLLDDGFFTTPIKMKPMFPTVNYLREIGINLSVVASDHIQPGQIKGMGEVPDVDLAMRLAVFCSQRSPVCLIEADNEINREFDVKLLQTGDVPVFTTNASRFSSDDELADALEYYRGFPDLAEKIATNGMLFVTDVKASRHDVNHYAQRFGFDPDRIFFADHHSYFQAPDRKKHDNGQPVVHPTRIPRQAQLAYMRCMNAGMRSELARRLSQATQSLAEAVSTEAVKARDHVDAPHALVEQ